LGAKAAPRPPTSPQVGHRHLRVTRLEPSLTRPCRLRTIKVEWITAAFPRQPHWERGKRPRRAIIPLFDNGAERTIVYSASLGGPAARADCR
jgi:hypothetical protein